MATNFHTVWLKAARTNPLLGNSHPEVREALRRLCQEFFAAGIDHHAETTRRLAAMVDEEDETPRKRWPVPLVAARSDFDQVFGTPSAAG